MNVEEPLSPCRGLKSLIVDDMEYHSLKPKGDLKGLKGGLDHPRLWNVVYTWSLMQRYGVFPNNLSDLRHF